MKVEGDYMVFSTGRKEFAYGGVIGLAPDLCVSCGWDDYVYTAGSDGLSRAERIELADYMIEQWQRFRYAAEVAE